MVRVAVIGCGLLGVKIAGELSYHGHCVKVHDPNAKALDSVYGKLQMDIQELQEEGLMLGLTFLGQLYCLSRLEDAVRDADYIFEAGPEDLTIKQEIFERISQNCKPNAVIASNSLRLNISDIASKIEHKERTIGVRFLFPVYYIPEVEISPGKETSLQTLEKVRNFLERMGKTVFFRSGPTPLILTEEQRDERKKIRKQHIELNQGLGGRCKYVLPELAHMGNFAPPQDDETTYLKSDLDRECAVCMDLTRDCVFHPCHHLCTCTACGRLLISRREGCPICRKEIQEIIRVFHS